MKIDNAVKKLRKAGAIVKVESREFGGHKIWAEFPNGEFIEAYSQDENDNIIHIYQSSHRLEETYKDQVDFSAGVFPKNIARAIRLALN